MRKFIDFLLELSKPYVVASQLLFFTLITIALYFTQNDNFTHLYFLSIVAASFYYGSWGGIFVGVVSALAIHFSFSAPHHSLPINMFLYTLVGFHAGISTDLLHYQINKYKDQAKELSVKEKDLSLKTKTLQKVIEIDKKILSGASLSETLEKAIEGVATTLKAKFALISLIEGRKLRIKAAYGLDYDSLAAIDQAVKPTLSKGILASVIKSKKSALIKKPAKNPGLENYRPLINAYSIKWAIVNPLSINNKALGAMAIFFGQNTAVSGAQFGQSNYFAQQIALAIHSNDLLEQVTNLALQTMQALVKAIEIRDPYTAGHSEKVMNYAVSIAKKISLSDEQVQMIRYAALLHDIGKLGIDDSIINKQTMLIKEEINQMRKHAKISADILKPIKLLEQVQSWVYHHQERYDGKGYPAGLEKENIPIGARIITIADAYDAMTSNRPYREALSKSQAIRELANLAGTQFDPELVKCFLGIIGL